MTLPEQNIIETQGRLLRQYAEELERLKSKQEPVAWATEDFEEIMTPEIRQAHIDHPQSHTHKFFPIPLYTTPQLKELSDEEIDEVLAEEFKKGNVTQRRFARAIIRKAQEK